MTINFTLFLQAINFYIAYLIIAKILLKPAIRIIKNDELIEEERLNNIKRLELEVSNKDSLKKSLWRRTKEKFDKQKPNISNLQSYTNWRTPQVKNLSELFTQDLKKKLSDFIFDTVKNVK